MMELLEKYKEELKVIGTVEAEKISAYPLPPVIASPITARENYLRFARREKPVFMAVDLDEVMLSPGIFPDAVARHFVVDHEGITDDSEGGKDMFGVDWVYIPAAGGSMVRPGNPKVKDIERWEKYITFPDIEKWDWEGSAKANKSLICREFATDIWIMNGMFERLISFLDFEDAAVALIDEEQKTAVHRLFDRLASLYEDMIGKIKKYYDVDLIYFHDDWGAQRAPFFSLEVCREMIVPYLKRVVDAAHRNGMYFNFHSCGKIETLVPAMIEAGVDIWCGQPMNDFKMMYDKYGRDITLGIYFLPPTAEAGTEEVIKACEDFLDQYTCNGYAFPVIYEPEYHPDFLKVLYVLSRERFA